MNKLQVLWNKLIRSKWLPNLWGMLFVLIFTLFLTCVVLALTVLALMLLGVIV